MRSAGEMSLRQAVTVPAILAGVMLSIGLLTGTLAGVDWSGLPAAYLTAGFGGTALALLLSVFFWVLGMARSGVDRPLQQVVVKCRACLPNLLVPAIILPLFLAGFTASKSAIPFLVGYTWDGTFAELDRLLLGDDAWRITHSWLSLAWLPLWEWFYTFGWGAVFFVGSALIAIHSSRRLAAIFFSAMLSTWLLGGFLAAYGFSAAGPVFTHLVATGSNIQFAELRAALAQSLAPDGLLRSTQTYLATSLNDHVAHKGGGISAMPSMHLGAASIFVLVARRSWWFAPAAMFWLLIFVLSAYFGYHYWVDAIPAAMIAWLSWVVAESFFNRSASGATADWHSHSGRTAPPLPV